MAVGAASLSLRGVAANVKVAKSLVVPLMGAFVRAALSLMGCASGVVATSICTRKASNDT